MEAFKVPFKGRSLLNWAAWTPEEITDVLDIAFQVKAEAHRGEAHSRFSGRTLALIFEKRSTRTRCAFETAFAEEGGHPVFLSIDDIQLGAKESLKDTARVLGRMFSAIAFRGYQQRHAEELVEYAGIPVINALTDAFHPTQALADMMTLKEQCGELKGLSLVFCGDGRNNVARSLMLICAKLGVHFSIFAPPELHPDTEILGFCASFAKTSGAKIEISDRIDIVKGADCLYTDVWTSMGEENVADQRTALLAPFQVNDALMQATGKTDTIFMHCLPAVKGQEVTEAVFESNASKVWDEAENRKHSIKAIMLSII